MRNDGELRVSLCRSRNYPAPSSTADGTGRLRSPADDTATEYPDHSPVHVQLHALIDGGWVVPPQTDGGSLLRPAA